MKHTGITILNNLTKIGKRIIVVLVIVSIWGVIANGTENVYGSTKSAAITTNKKNIRVKVISASGKQIKLRITNEGKKDFYFSELFVLKKYVNGKWKKIKFSDEALFRKTIIARNGKSITIKLKWKKYFGKNLTKGKYKIKFVKTKLFKIK